MSFEVITKITPISLDSELMLNREENLFFDIGDAR